MSQPVPLHPSTPARSSVAPSFDTSIETIANIEAQLTKLTPLLYLKLKHPLHEQTSSHFLCLRATIEAIYLATTISPEEEVSAWDVLKKVTLVGDALKLSGLIPLKTKEQLAHLRTASEKKYQDFLHNEKQKARQIRELANTATKLIPRKSIQRSPSVKASTKKKRSKTT